MFKANEKTKQMNGGGMLAQLAAEEEKHDLLLENIIDFLSRPEQWLENAEGQHLEAY